MADKHKTKVKKFKTSDEVEVLKATLARALADYDNLVKRTERDQDTVESVIKARVVARLLPVFDMLEGAQKNLEDQGIALIIKEFEDAFKDLGVEKVLVSLGDEFDEHLHEAVDTMQGKDDGKIAEILMSGWATPNGKVLRHTKVKVTKSSQKRD